MDTVSGTIERITYHNKENGYFVIKIKAKRHRDLVTIIGNTPKLSVGELIEAEGQWHTDRRYGPQFKSNLLKSLPPTSLKGIERYLASGLIKGIGKVFAQKLVDHFGEEVLDIIEKEPERLHEIQGVGKKKVDSIISAWESQNAIRDIMVFLQSHGVGTTRAHKIYKKYGNDAIETIMNNPYQLVTDIYGIGFKVADDIGLSIGIDKDSIKRARAGVLYVLTTTHNDGHTCIEEETLIDKSIETLGISRDIVTKGLNAEIYADTIIYEEIEDKAYVYVNWLYYSEIGVASHISRLQNTASYLDNSEIEGEIRQIQQETAMTFAQSQIEAIKLALGNKVCLLTGGPGVGKTTIVNAVIKLIGKHKDKIALCAPTGRAAKRLSESTGKEAKTIHRLLEYNFEEGGFYHNDENKLCLNYIVIDECSMNDTVLTNSLLRALPDDCGVLFVGDVDQLPSVGPGKVLTDLIDSGVIPTARLSQIFRQAEESQIIVNAHKINQSEAPLPTPKGMNTDFYSIACDDSQGIYTKMMKIISDKIPKMGFNPIRDVQVLVPMHNGGLGVKVLNHDLQERLNTDAGDGIERYGVKFCKNDKVIQNRNNYNKDVYNGDIGYVQSINLNEETLCVRYDHDTVEYEFHELDEIQLAYATTIHKSQGSEFPVVIIPISMQHFMMLKKNLLYTGVTRGKKLVILLNEQKALKMCVKTLARNNRITNLRYRLESKVG